MGDNMKLISIKSVEDWLMGFLMEIIEYLYQHMRFVYNAHFHCRTFFSSIVSMQNDNPPAIIFFLVNIFIVSVYQSVLFPIISELITMKKTDFESEKVQIIQTLLSCLPYLFGFVILSIIIKLYLKKTEINWGSIIRAVCYSSAFFYGLIVIDNIISLITISFQGVNGVLAFLDYIPDGQVLLTSNYNGFKEMFVLNMFGDANADDSMMTVVSMFSSMSLFWVIGKLLIFQLVLVILTQIPLRIHYKDNKSLFKGSVTIALLFLLCQFALEVPDMLKSVNRSRSIFYYKNTIESLLSKNPVSYGKASMASWFYANSNITPKIVSYEKMMDSAYFAFRSLVPDQKAISKVKDAYENKQYDEVAKLLEQTISDIEKQETKSMEHTKVFSSVRYILDQAKEIRKDIKYQPAFRSLQVLFVFSSGSIRIVP